MDRVRSDRRGEGEVLRRVNRVGRDRRGEREVYI